MPAVNYSELRKRSPTISIRPLKVFVAEKLPESHVLREIVVCEPDVLAIESFLAKVPIWLMLLRNRSRLH